MDSNNTPAKNITESWLNNISENLALLSRYERGFRVGIESLAELSNIFYECVNRDLRLEYYREAQVRTAEMFISLAQAVLTDCYGFISETDYNALEQELIRLSQIIFNDKPYYYGAEYCEYSGITRSMLILLPAFNSFIDDLMKLRLKLVKVLSPLLFAKMTRQENKQV